jgi:hypothetical protein
LVIFIEREEDGEGRIVQERILAVKGHCSPRDNGGMPGGGFTHLCAVVRE